MTSNIAKKNTHLFSIYIPSIHIQTRVLFFSGMNNQTCLYNRTGIDVLIWQIGAFVFPVVGIPGHVLMIIVMFNANKRHSQPTALYFIAISIIESIYLIFIFWDWLDVVNLAPDPRRVLNCAFFYPFVGGTGLLSLLFLVQLNLDRILIIHQPRQISVYITHQRILIKILLTSSVLLLYLMHYYFSLHYDAHSFIIFGQSCRVYPRAERWFYSIWPYVNLSSRLIPCLILILSTITIFHNRHSTASFATRTHVLHRHQQTISLVLVLLSIYTLLALIPISILQIFNQYIWKDQCRYFRCHCFQTQRHVEQWKLFNVICIMWETSIYTMKFYVKICVSTDFRHDVQRLIFFRLKNRRTRRANRFLCIARKCVNHVCFPRTKKQTFINE